VPPIAPGKVLELVAELSKSASSSVITTPRSLACARIASKAQESAWGATIEENEHEGDNENMDDSKTQDVLESAWNATTQEITHGDTSENGVRKSRPRRKTLDPLKSWGIRSTTTDAPNEEQPSVGLKKFASCAAIPGCKKVASAIGTGRVLELVAEMSKSTSVTSCPTHRNVAQAKVAPSIATIEESKESMQNKENEENNGNMDSKEGGDNLMPHAVHDSLRIS